MSEVRAKKSLGQHFLTDLDVARRIADTISPEALPEADKAWGSLPVVEVGPGMGVLTRFLCEAGRDVTAVELDSESVSYLHREMPGLRVVEGDFLKLNLDSVVEGEMALQYLVADILQGARLQGEDSGGGRDASERGGAEDLRRPRIEDLRHTIGAAAGMV